MVRHPDLLGPLIDVPKEVLEGLGNFLIAISCGWVMDPAKFGEFCKKVDQLMIDHVGWHPSVPSIHLDLIHGQLLMDHFFPLPLSFLSEEPLESHNKRAKMFRRYHTMTIDRTQSMKQWIQRSLDSSDPLVLQESQAERLKLRKKFLWDDLPKVLQDMVITGHPYNKFHL